MNLLRRLFAWMFSLLLIGAAGVGVFLFVRNTPRCTIERPGIVRHFSADGRWLVSLAPALDEPMASETPARLRVYDTRSGRIVHSLPAPMDLRQSPDGRLFSWLRADGFLQLIDWQKGKVWSPPVLLARNGLSKYEFSPGGRWLWADTWQGQSTNVLVDLTTRQLVPWPEERFLQFAKNDRHALYFIDAKNVGVADCQTGETVGCLTPNFAMHQVGVCSSSDGRRIVLANVWNVSQETMLVRPEWRHCEPIEHYVFFDVEVWDLVERRRLWASPNQLDSRSPRYGGLAFSPDGGHLAFWAWAEEGPRLDVVDLDSGATTALLGAETFASDMSLNRRLTFFPASAKGAIANDAWFLLCMDGNGRPISVANAQRLLWKERPGAGSFVRSAGCILAQDLSLNVLDLATGRRRSILPPDFRNHLLPKLTSDGAYAVIPGEDARPERAKDWLRDWLEAKWPQVFATGRKGVIIVETATGRERFRLLRPRLDWLQLSDDGGTLATFRYGSGPLAAGLDRFSSAESVLIWDVHPGRAIGWAVAAAFSMSGLFLVVRRWRKRRIGIASARAAR